MADSKNKPKKSSLHSFEDDLDAMFEESELLDDAPRTDEDELDRLLRDDTFAKSKPLMDQDDDLDKLFESAEPQSSPSKKAKDLSTKNSKQDIDMLLDKANASDTKAPKKPQNDADVFAEIDDFDEFASFDDEPIASDALEVAQQSIESTANVEEDFDAFDIFDEDFDQPKSTIVKAVEPETPAVVDTEPENPPTPPAAKEESVDAEVDIDAEFGNDDFDLNFDDAFSELDDSKEPELQNETKVVIPEPDPSVATTSDAASTALQHSNDALQEDDFLIADFDITSDDEFEMTAPVSADKDIETGLDAGIEASSSVPINEEGLQDAFSELDDFLEEETQTEPSESVLAAIAPVELPPAKNTPDSSDQSELLAQISALWAAQDLLKQQFAATATAMGPAETISSELDLLAKEQKSLRQLMEHNTKKTPGIVYGGIAVGTLALLLGGGLVAMHFKTQAEFQALQEQNTLLQKELASFKGTGASPSTPEDVKSSISGIAQQVLQIQEKLTTIDKTDQIDALQASVAGMKVDMNNLIKKGVELNAQAALATTAHSEHEAKVDHPPEPEHKVEHKQELAHTGEVEHKSEHAHQDGTEHKVEAEHKVEEGHKVEVEHTAETKPVAEHKHDAQSDHQQGAHAETKPDIASATPVIAVEKSHESAAELAATSKAPEQIPVKSVAEKVPEKAKPVRVNRVIAEVEKKPKPKPKPVAIRNEASQESGRWNANLVSFRQDWYAQRKAAEFAQKGIRVSVIPVEVKGETWYRLRAGGFSNRSEANNYAAKVKKQLNLTSVWVTEE